MFIKVSGIYDMTTKLQLYIYYDNRNSSVTSEDQGLPEYVQ